MIVPVAILFAQVAGGVIPAQVAAPIVARAVPTVSVMVTMMEAGTRRKLPPVMAPFPIILPAPTVRAPVPMRAPGRSVEVNVDRKAGVKLLRSLIARLGGRRARHYP